MDTATTFLTELAMTLSKQVINHLFLLHDGQGKYYDNNKQKKEI